MVDRFIDGVGVGLAAAVAVDRNRNVVDEFIQLPLVIVGHDFPTAWRSALVPTTRRYPLPVLATGLLTARR